MISRNSITPAHPPQLQLQLPWAPSPSPSTPPLTSFTTDVLVFPPPPSKHQQQPIDFSPPLIAMVVIAAVAFLIVTYSRLLSRHFLPPLLRQFRRYRRWRRRRQLLLPSSVDGSVVMDSPPYVVDVYGLDDSVIKSMPLSVYSSSDKSNGGPIDEFQFPGDCAVCLLEFVDNDYVRTLPLCVHSFHVDCIDVWLRSHASCPLCRAGVLPRDWPTSLSPVPLVPVMASRIRPSFDEGLLLDSIFLDPPPSRSRRRSDSVATVPEIVPAQSESEAAAEARPGMLKRSYSFGFERNFSSERLVMEPATASPWRHRLHHHHHHRRGSLSFWRRPSPFSALAKHHRVFSFRSNRASIKSPFSGRRRGVGGAGFAPLSESACIRYTYYHSSSRGSKSMAMASPMFGRSSVSSRMRCGDPEALISPERYREP